MSLKHQSLTGRRSGLPLPTLIVVVSAILLAAVFPRPDQERAPVGPEFLIRSDELTLRPPAKACAPVLAFDHFTGEPETWRAEGRARLALLLGSKSSQPGPVRELRSKQAENFVVHALLMQVSPELSLPAYLLEPTAGTPVRGTVLALHGRGSVEALIGVGEDYHHRFAIWLARNGYVVLCPELRGFGKLRDMTRDSPAHAGHFTPATDAIQRGETLIGQSVDDLLRWEEWLAARGYAQLDVVGISYGGNLAYTYAAFSDRVKRIFVSGALGSFEGVFTGGGNAPAHCIPGVLKWFDPSDIAGLNAPRPLAIHCGAQDLPGATRPDSQTSVEPAFERLRRIYASFGAADAVELMISPTRGREMDVEMLLEWLQRPVL